MKENTLNIRLQIPEILYEELTPIFQQNNILATPIADKMMMKDGLVYFNIIAGTFGFISTCLEIYNSLQAMRDRKKIIHNAVVEVLGKSVEIDPNKSWKLIETKLDALLRSTQNNKNAGGNDQGNS